MRKAFIYVRVSTVDQEYSPEAQEAQARLYCQVKGYEVAAVFNEPAISGAKPFATRDQGGALLSRVGEVDAIVFTKLDRAFRDTVDCIVTVRGLVNDGKAVHFLDLGMDTSTPVGKMCLTMMVAFAEFERGRIGERTREALAVAKSRGVKLGAPALGSRGDEARTVERIRELAYLPSYSEIARTLNAEGFRTRHGKAFTHVQIGRVFA